MFKNADGVKGGSPVSADNPISLGEVSLLIMKAFALKGGIAYFLFPVSRYACGEEHLE
jgi:hypothetical protein